MERQAQLGLTSNLFRVKRPRHSQTIKTDIAPRKIKIEIKTKNLESLRLLNEM